jgi:hypothetical protein
MAAPLNALHMKASDSCKIQELISPILKKVSGLIELEDDLSKHETAEGHRTEPSNIEQYGCHCICATLDE